MIIYGVHYLYHQEPSREYFAREKDARARFAELRIAENVAELELEREEIMRPSADTILRILNHEPYVIKREVIIKSTDSGGGVAR